MADSSDFERPVSCKIVMIGNSGVGKTSLVNSWVNGQYSNKTSPTIGANHLRKIVRVDDEALDVCVWDTAGQEQYHSLTPLYTRAAAAAIAVASINDPESFAKLNMWLDLVKESCDEVPPTILAVSKIDLSNEKSPSEEEIESKYGEAFKGIFFTSALSGENVNALFLFAAKEGISFMKAKGQIPNLNNNALLKTSPDNKKNGCC